MTVIGTLSSFRELGEMSSHKRASNAQTMGDDKPTYRELANKPKGSLNGIVSVLRFKLCASLPRKCETTDLPGSLLTSPTQERSYKGGGNASSSCMPLTTFE